MKPHSPDKNNFSFELRLRVSLHDYKAKLGLKTAWITAVVLGLLRIAVKLWLDGS